MDFVLPLNDMAERHPGLTSAIAENYLEAARVCFDRHHTSPETFTLTIDNNGKIITVQWEFTDERCQKAWANKDDATRDGAYICALAAIELMEERWVAVHRAQTGTGADYYIAPSGQNLENFEDFENWFRLEVSGTDQGNESDIKRRLEQKVRQAQNGKSNVPALAAVVGFKAKSIIIQSVESLL
jgi:hypothetical protein